MQEDIRKEWKALKMVKQKAGMKKVRRKEGRNGPEMGLTMDRSERQKIMNEKS